jgi:AmmeMemoRadiSam system protein A
LGDEERRILLQLARSSIDAGLLRGAPLTPDPSAYTGELCEHRTSFVTLRMSDKALRGCIGSTEAVRSLVADVAYNAWAAAFRDPRFDPLCRDEFDDVNVHISVLSPLEPLPAGSEKELLERLRPGIDGLFVREGSRQGHLAAGGLGHVARRQAVRVRGAPQGRAARRLLVRIAVVLPLYSGIFRLN